MAVALETVVKQLEDSGIVAPGKLENFVPPKAHPKSVEELVRELVKNNHLTKFQAQQVALGKAKALILGGYTIVDKIGAGGMGQVYKALHRRMERTVAIKMLPPATMKDPAAVARFDREVKAAAKLSHPNIVAAHDADEANGVHFLVMEYVPGTDLSSLVKKHGPLAGSQALNYVLQAARGLEYAHKKGVVHRDIKPANLLVDPEGTVKILDMGLARIETSGEAATQAELTGTGAVMGTVDYMAPEQALSTKTADARADIYSLGCTLYYLLTGQATYGGETLMAKLLAHREAAIPPLPLGEGGRRPGEGSAAEGGAPAPADVQALFARMIAKRVEDRPQTMSEVVAELERIIASGSAPDSLAPPAESTDTGLTKFFQNLPAGTTHKGSPTMAAGAAATASPTAARARPAAGSQRPSPAVLYGSLAAGGLSLLGIPLVLYFALSGGRTERPRGNPPAAAPAASASKSGSLFCQDPAFATWLKEAQALPPQPQIDRVRQKLKELNPTFDGMLGFPTSSTPRVVKGVVTEVGLNTDCITDLSPLRAFGGLQKVNCRGTTSNGILADLSPLAGMQLIEFSCVYSRVTDLSPLAGMPLVSLNVNATVADLSALRGMPLEVLYMPNALNADLSPLRGMPLERFYCYNTRVSDLSPLAGMPLVVVNCSGTPVSDLSPLGTCPGLKTVEATRTKITAATVAALQRAVPECQIDWDGAGGSIPAGSSGSAVVPASKHLLQFDGKSWVELPTLKMPLPPAYTVETWMRPESDRRAVLVRLRTSPALHLSTLSPAKAQVMWDGARPFQKLTGGSIAPGEWRHLAVVVEGAEHRLYVNGVLAKAQRFTLHSRNDEEQWLSRLGSESNGGAAFVGLMGPTRISKSARYRDTFNPPGQFTTDADTLALYHFNEGTGDQLLDSSPNKHHGKITGAKWVPGIAAGPAAAPQPSDHALDFDGKTGYVAIPTWKYQGDHPLTIEAWATMRGTSMFQVLWGDMEGQGLDFSASDTNWLFQLGASTGVKKQVYSLAPPTKGHRTHLATTFSGNEMRLFVDGRQQGQPVPYLYQYKSPQRLFYLGAQPRANDTPDLNSVWNGTIDEVRISKVVRYNADFPPKPRFEVDADTIALYHFDEGTGDQLLDSSPNKHHGKIVGAKWVPGIAGGPQGAAGSSGSAGPGFALDLSVAADGTIPQAKLPASLSRGQPFTVELTAVARTAAGPTMNRGIWGFNPWFTLKLYEDRWSWIASTIDAEGKPRYTTVGPRGSLQPGRTTRLATVFTGSELLLFVDGRKSGSEKVEGQFSAEPYTGGHVLGRQGAIDPKWEAFDGTIEALRISGIARYQADYVPAETLTADKDTLALYLQGQGHGDTLVNLSGNNHHGKIIGAKWAPGPAGGAAAGSRSSAGYALDFDGQTSLVTIPSLVWDQYPQATLELSAIPRTKVEGSKVLVRSEGNGLFQFRHRGDSWIGLWSGATGSLETTTSAGLFVPEKEVQIAMVLEKQTLRLFLDGKLAATTTSDMRPSRKEFVGTWIGGTPLQKNSPSFLFPGVIDEVRISKIARYLADYVPTERLDADADTLALYHFDEGSGDQLLDSSPNKHHGKIVGARWIPGIAGGTGGSGAAWQPLFNGADFKGWTGDTSRWRVEQKQLTTNPSGNAPHWLSTDRVFGDFTLGLQAYVSGRSGLRLEGTSTFLDIPLAGGSTVAESGRFITSDKKLREPVARAFRHAEMNDLQIIRRGSSVKVLINGALVNEADGKTLPELERLGPVKISLLSYGGRASFDNLQIRELTGPPTDPQTFGGHRYQFVPDKLSWPEAKARAEQMGGHLATITSKEENDWIKATFVKPLPAGLGIWLGGNHGGTPGAWKWVTGEPFAFIAWSPGEPNNTTAESALLFPVNAVSGVLGWVDMIPEGVVAAGDRRGGFVVEWDSPLSPYEILTSPDYEWSLPENLGPLVNTAGDESGPTLSADGLTLIYEASSRTGGHGYHDLWMTRRASQADPWSPPENLGPTVNDKSSEVHPELSADGLTLLFASDRATAPGKFRLWHTTRPALHAPWTSPKRVLDAITEPAGVGSSSPALSRDGLELLFFSSTRPGARLADLWRCRRARQSDPWGAPENLGATVNSDGEEYDPALSSDGRVLVFNSRRDGNRRTELWWSSRTANGGPWSAAQKIGRRIESPYDVSAPALSVDGQTLLFASYDRPGGQGKSDLWQSRRVRKAAAKPTPYEILTSPDYEWTTPENLGPVVNSDDAESSPCLSADGLTLLFDSGRPGGQGKHDLWLCRRPTPVAPWSAPENLGAPLNSSANEKGPSLSADGLTLVLSSDREHAEGTYQLWLATRPKTDQPWSPPQRLGSSGDNEPEISADGLAVLFHTTRAGGHGGEDLWMYRRSKTTDAWGPPENLGPVVNSSAREFSAALSSDQRVLLFSSDRDGGQGRPDLWLSSRAAVTAPWSAPVNLGPPVNTAFDEMCPTLSADGSTLIFRSNRRPGTLGKDGSSDLWQSRRVRKTSSPPAGR